MRTDADAEACLSLSLHGAPSATLLGAVKREVTGARNLALIAVLATAPGMKRSRGFLADTLWSDNTEVRARANLRQLLHALGKAMGPAFDEIVDVGRDYVALRPERVILENGSKDGAFLEGIDLRQEGFEEWLRAERLARPEQGRGTDLDAAVYAETLLPRIMVLPFGETHTGAATGLGDALAHSLSGAFARSQLIDAISHFSGRQFQASGAGDVCDYMLTGQVRHTDQILTVDVSLVSASDMTVLWSQQEQARLADYLAGEGQLVLDIAGQSLRVITSRAIARSATTPLPDLAAHVLLVSAVGLMHAFEKRHFQRAEEQIAEVIKRCPDASTARAWQAQWHVLRIYQKWSDASAKDTAAANAAIQNALDLNPDCALSLAVAGNIETILKTDFSRAATHFDKALDINPSSAFISQLASVLATFQDEGREAMRLAERAYDLSPRDPRRPFFQSLSAGSYVAGGHYAKAVELAEASLRKNPLHLSAHRARVIGLQLSGQEAKARDAAKALLQLDPTMSVSAYLRDHPAAQSKGVQSWADALRAAGVPIN